MITIKYNDVEYRIHVEATGNIDIDAFGRDLKQCDGELEKCTQLLSKHWPSAMGCNGHLQVAGHLGNILKDLQALKEGE